METIRRKGRERGREGDRRNEVGRKLEGSWKEGSWKLGERRGRKERRREEGTEELIFNVCSKWQKWI